MWISMGNTSQVEASASARAGPGPATGGHREQQRGQSGWGVLWGLRDLSRTLA